MRAKYRVNLLLKRKKRIGNEIVYFLLHYFRYILVITQIIIIIVFFYRFKIDQDVVDLNDTLRQQKEIVQVLQPFITDFNQKYERFLKVGEILDKQNFYEERLDYLLSIFPANFYLSRLSFDKDGIELEGKSLDYLTIMRFYNRVKKDGRFSEVNLISVDKEGGFFGFKIEVKGFKLASKKQ